ncbi:MAG: hypothetical protein C5B59_06685 [Bacteroidetes bacterium]|nr:MAG: hypothetical protein C5B59_06685 [Bacteroidota bacterium]
MITLTKKQNSFLFMMVRDHGLVASQSIPSDGEASWGVDQVFAERMQLVEYGLAVIDKGKMAQKFIKDIKEIEGRDVIVLQPTKITKLMFRRGACSRAIN